MRIIKKIIVFMLVLSTTFGIVLVKSDKPDIAYATGDHSMILIEQESGRILYEHDANKRRPMASTTKIATAITVIENYAGDLDELVVVPDKAVGIEGSSIYLQKGEQLSVKDLLYGLMLQSGNDCAVALAILTGGSIENFASMMNNLAKKCNALSTNFVNPNGLHDDNHYTTASDLAKIAAYAMKNQLFREIVSTKRYEAPWKDHDYNRVILNKNKILSTFEGGNGIKTGYTKKAGRCLVSSATRDGMTVICVVLNCGPMFEECSRLMNKAFEEYELKNLVPDQNITFAAVLKGKSDFVPLAAKGKILYPIKKDGSEKIGYGYEGVKALTAPVKKDTENGKLNIYLNKQLIFSEKMFTIYGVDGKSLADFIKEL